MKAAITVSAVVLFLTVAFARGVLSGNEENQGVLGEDVLSLHVLGEDVLSLHHLIQHLIKNESDLNITDRMGRTLAHRAADMGDITSLQLLINNNAGHLMNLTDTIGQSPVHVAAKSNRPQVIEFLADQGVDLDSEDYYRKTPLHRAAENGHLDSLKMLIKKGVEANRRIRYYDMTAMHLAAAADHVDIIRELSHRNNTLNTRDADERTPLWHAVNGDKINSVKELVALGADITPMVIWVAVDKGHLSIVKYLVNNGADVNARAGIDSSLLVRAAYRGSLDVATFLIDKGADVRATCCYIRWTPLHEAASYDRVAMAKLFMDRGANINAMDRRGLTPLDVAGPAVHKALSERGAKIGSQI